jgi:hypothetical protein
MQIFLRFMPIIALAAVINLTSQHLVEKTCELGPPPVGVAFLKAVDAKRQQNFPRLLPA